MENCKYGRKISCKRKPGPKTKSKRRKSKSKRRRKSKGSGRKYRMEQKGRRSIFAKAGERERGEAFKNRDKLEKVERIIKGSDLLQKFKFAIRGESETKTFDKLSQARQNKILQDIAGAIASNNLSNNPFDY